MKREEVLRYADIKHDGSILIGNHTVCDGVYPGRKIGVFTHIHRDHTLLLVQAMHECSGIYVSPPTLDLLAALDQDYHHSVSAESYFKGRHIHALNFDQPVVPKLNEFSPSSGYGDRITLKASKHILGSCQVLVETNDNKRIFYSSDFASGTKPEPCDILVLDATHGDPMFDTQLESGSLERRLIDAVEAEISRGRSILIRAHRGRLQYTMHLLSALPDDIKLLADKTDIKLIPVYQKYGMSIRDVIEIDSFEGEKIQSGGFPFIEFRTHGMTANFLEGTEKMTVFKLGGKNLGGGTVLRHVSDNEYNLEFMDHANYSAIINYVKEASPQCVITDFSRGKQAMKLAARLGDEGFEAIPLPGG